MTTRLSPDPATTWRTGCGPAGPPVNRSRVRIAGWRLTRNRSSATTDARDVPPGSGIITTRFIVRPVRCVVSQIFRAQPAHGRRKLAPARLADRGRELPPKAEQQRGLVGDENPADS